MIHCAEILCLFGTQQRKGKNLDYLNSILKVRYVQMEFYRDFFYHFLRECVT